MSFFGSSARAATYSASAFTSFGLSLSRTTAPSPQQYDACECPEKLLKALGAECKAFGTNDEETYTCGEGAVVLDKLHPELVADLARYVAARADDPKKDTFAVGSVYAKRALCAAGLRARTFEELAASCL